MEGSFYDEKYFDWQKDVGAFGGKANQIKFLKYITRDGLKVLDFGCGGGFLISSFEENIERYGVEINDVAVEPLFFSVPPYADTPVDDIKSSIYSHLKCSLRKTSVIDIAWRACTGSRANMNRAGDDG